MAPAVRTWPARGSLSFARIGLEIHGDHAGFDLAFPASGAAAGVFEGRKMNNEIATSRVPINGEPVNYEPPPVSLQDPSILSTALSLARGDRQVSYGHPFHDFSRTAAIWGAILGCPVSPEQVALCQIAVKISRECNKPGRDNRVDIAGYADCLDRVVEYREERAKKEFESGQEEVG